MIWSILLTYLKLELALLVPVVLVDVLRPMPKMVPVAKVVRR